VALFAALGQPDPGDRKAEFTGQDHPFRPAIACRVPGTSCDGRTIGSAAAAATASGTGYLIGGLGVEGAAGHG